MDLIRDFIAANTGHDIFRRQPRANWYLLPKALRTEFKTANFPRPSCWDRALSLEYSRVSVRRTRLVERAGF